MIHCLRLSVAALALLLAGCQTLPETAKPPSSDADWQTDLSVFEPVERQIKELTQWRLSAKALVKNNTRSDQVNLDWSHAADANQLRLFGPLGMGAVKVDFDEFSVQMSDRNGLVYQGLDPDALLTDVTGLTLPLTALERWIFALPVQGVPLRYKITQSGGVMDSLVLDQQGWLITYSGFQRWGDPEVDAPYLPRKIVATGVDSEGQTIRVRVVVKQWTLGAVAQ